MQVYSIAGDAALEGKYKGTGYAIGAVVRGQLVDFAYLRDVLPDFEGDYTEDGDGQDLAMQALTDDRLGPTVRHMQARGEVVAGMCSAYELVVL